MEWFVLALFAVAFILLCVASARGMADKKTVLFVKKCEEGLCADPLLTPRLVLKLNHGERPVPGQVLKCSLANHKLYCGNEVELEVDSVMLQSVE